RKNYFYHLQDIHPEASNLVVKIPRFLFFCMREMENITVKSARKVITLSDEMAGYIYSKRNYHGEVVLLENPSGYVPYVEAERDNEFVFCGNAGRLQRIPLIVEAIRKYRSIGGVSTFTFIGSGVHADLLSKLEKQVSG